MKKLRKALRKAHHALGRTQAGLRRALKTRKWLHDHKLGAAAKAVGKVADRLKARAHNQNQHIRDLERKIKEWKDEHSGPSAGREQYVAWLNSVVGAVEYGTLHKTMVAFLVSAGYGGSTSWPWCSCTVAYGLCHAGGLDADELPTNPWYSGAWLNWSGGHRVPYSEAIPGDLLIFDWGDGGITDHVATYVGGGIKIGGNENNRIEKDAVPVSNLVGVIRVNW